MLYPADVRPDAWRGVGVGNAPSVAGGAGVTRVKVHHPGGFREPVIGVGLLRYTTTDFHVEAAPTVTFGGFQS